MPDANRANSGSDKCEGANTPLDETILCCAGCSIRLGHKWEICIDCNEEFCNVCMDAGDPYRKGFCTACANAAREYERHTV